MSRLHERELYHADTIDDMHLGDHGVVTLEKRLSSSFQIQEHLASRANEMNMTLEQCQEEVTSLKSKLVDCDKARLETKGELERAREELEASCDREMHLQHDVERLETKIVTLEHGTEETTAELERMRGLMRESEERMKLTMEESARMKRHEHHAVKLEQQVKRLEMERDSNKKENEHCHDVLAKTKEEYQHILKEQKNNNLSLEKEMNDLSKERDEILSELTDRLRQLDGEKERIRTLESTLKQADAHIEKEARRRKDEHLELEECKRVTVHLHEKLEENQVRQLEATKESILQANSLTTWKTKYKSLEEERRELKSEKERLKKLREEVRFVVDLLSICC